MNIYKIDGTIAGEITLADDVFGVEVNPVAIHQVVVAQLAAARQGTQCALTRSEVRGGGIKPWRQKGTGRARAGDVKSPIWVGGGIVFGPDGNQNYSLSQNKKEHNLALRGVLYEKAENKGIVVVDALALDKISTKAFAESLKAMKVSGKKNLLVTDIENENVIASARNIESLVVTTADNISVYDVLYFDNIIVSKDGIHQIEEALK